MSFWRVLSIVSGLVSLVSFVEAARQAAAGEWPDTLLLGLVLAALAWRFHRRAARTELAAKVRGPSRVTSDLSADDVHAALDDDGFWSLVDEARQSARDDEDALQQLTALCEPLEPVELVAFRLRLDEHLNDAYRWDLWAAAFLIEGGCSDDGFLYFRAWLVLQGRERFEAALADPESLADWIETAVRTDCESLLYLPIEVFEKNTGQGFPHDHLPRSPSDPEGEPWDEDDVATVLPKLAAKVGWPGA
ncbi:MAG: DUF4240 domain-containing protein [Acidobacteriota bacterium]